MVAMVEQDGESGPFYAEKSDWPKLGPRWSYELLCLQCSNWKRPFRDRDEAKASADYHMTSNQGHKVVVTPISPRPKT